MSPSILTEEISRSPVLLGILIRRQQIKSRYDFSAHRRNRVVRNDEDKIIAADVPDESFFATCSLHNVVEQLRQNPDHAVAFVVAVAVVEFLEVVEVGVANREVVAARQTAADFGFDRR